MVLIIILGAMVFLLIDYLISAEFYEAAVMKGHPKKKYLWLPFFFGIIGWLLVIALPDRNAANNAPVYGAGTPTVETKKPDASADDSLPEL